MSKLDKDLSELRRLHSSETFWWYAMCFSCLLFLYSALLTAYFFGHFVKGSELRDACTCESCPCKAMK